MQDLSTGLAFLLIAAYGLGLVFSLEPTASCSPARGLAKLAKCHGRRVWLWRRLLALQLLIALVSEIFVESVQEAA